MLTPGLATTLLVCLGLLLEVCMVRRAAAFGAWVGSALKHPAAAGVCGAIGGALLWGLRAFLLFFALMSATRAFGYERRTAGVWSWIGTFVALDLLITAALTPFLMWLARGALSAPWRARAGRRLRSLLDGWLLAAEGLEASDRSIWHFLRRPEGKARKGRENWRLWMVWIFACAACLALAIPFGGWVAELSRSQLAAPMMLAMVMIAGLLFLSAIRLTMRMSRGLRNWVREARNP
jgi:hypothetical protein